MLQKSAPGREKKPTPAPIPGAGGALMNPLIASVTAVHLVGGTAPPLGGLSQAVSAAEQFMEIDLSTMMKRSTMTGVLSLSSAAHAASALVGGTVAEPPVWPAASETKMKPLPPLPPVPPAR